VEVGAGRVIDGAVGETGSSTTGVLAEGTQAASRNIKSKKMVIFFT
jgi:hypothetical protein